MTNYRPGERVTGQVSRILSNKVLVRLDDGTLGVIRRRELSWDSERPDPHRLLKPGQQIQAVVIDTDPEHHTLELSLRLAQYDPWKTFGAQHRVGDKVVGIVRRVRDFGAFVEIEKGVEGLLPASEIPAPSPDARGSPGGKRAAFRVSEVLWVGDWVKAQIKDLDPEHYRMRLSIKSVLRGMKEAWRQQRRQTQVEAPLLEHLTPEARQKLLRLAGDIPDEVKWPTPNRIRRILVVDDNKDFLDSLAHTLEEWGYHVHKATNHEEASQEIRQKAPFDLAILDLMLIDGPSLKLADEIRAASPNTHLLLLCGREPTEEVARHIETQGYELECKPFGPEALAEHLIRLEHLREPRRRPPKAHRQAREKPATAPSVQQPMEEHRRLPSPSHSESNTLLHTILVDLCEATQARQVVLFRNTPTGIKVAAYAGPEVALQGEQPLTLRYSPVGDVLEEGRPIRIEDVEHNPAQAKYLLRVIPFRSALGVPVRVRGVPSPYALFCFSDEPHHFQHQPSRATQHLVAELSLALLQHHLLGILFKTQQEVLLSRLRAGALHDVRNAMGAMELRLQRLAARVEEAEDPEAFLTVRSEIQLLLGQIRDTAVQMRRTLNLFRELVSDKAETLSINALLRRSVARLHPLANDLNVELAFHPDPEVPDLHLPPLHLQQAVENVLLNAVQWCAGRPVRRVEVSSKHVPDSPFPVEIRIRDTGPGIHGRLQEERIYEMGFSTRKEGTGLGLFIARTLIEGAGGKVQVEESFMGLGTTFLLALPHTQPYRHERLP